jgi:hypothetical protein
VNSSRTDNTVAIDSHALGTLNYIRASIEAAGAFAVPGIAGIAMGGVGLMASLVAALAGPARWLEVWLLAAIAAAAIGVLLVARQPARGFTLYRGPARKFVLSLCPSLLAGAVLTVVLWQEHTALIPGMWLLLYGCAVLSASLMTCAAMMRLIAIMGGLFVAYGVVTFELPRHWHNFALGSGFGALHLIFGVLIGRADRVE